MQPGIVPGSVIYGEMIKPAETKQYDLRFVQTLVPGRGRAYSLTSTALVSQWDELAPAFDAARASFCVLERPKRGPPAVNGALQGGLVVIGLGLLVLAVTGLVTRD
jgi:hypothetical protein